MAKILILGGISLSIRDAFELAGHEVIIAKHHFEVFSKVDSLSLPPRGKGKGDRVRRRQQWVRK